MATPPALIYTDDNSLTSAAVTVTSSYSGKLQASNYGSAVVTIDASARTKAIDITGNTKNNSIKGGSGNDTLSGGTGNDTLTGGNGKDLFVYASGNDVITDYTAGQDTLKISSGSISGYSFSGDDAVFTIGKGSVTVSGGKNSAVTVIDSKKKTFTYQNGLIQDNSAVAKAKAVTVTAANSGTVTAADYGAAVITIDASARANSVNITGNTKNNKIIGTAGNDTISGNSGKNTLTGGKGNDLFIYSGGNDVITDYTSGDDTIQIASGAISSYSVSGKDVSMKIGKNTLKVTGGKTATLTILDAENNVNIYQSGLIYNNEIASATALSVTSAYGNTLSSYGANVEIIDASTKNKAIKITGNSKNNSILGSAKNDTIDGGAGADVIQGGKGNDVLTGGAGNDIFIYTDGDGKDTITDYSAGDVISLSGDYNISYSYSSAKGGTSTFKIGKSGSIAVKNSANAVVTLIGANGEASIGIKNSFLAVNDIPGFSPGSGTNETVYVTVPAETVNVTLPAETITVGGGDTITVTVEAEPVTITVGGGESIIGTSKADTLTGTAGNDTVSLGGGVDVYIYEGGGDFDIITDYTAGEDKISIGANSISGGAVVGNDIFFMINGGVLQLTGAKDKAVKIIRGDTETEYVNLNPGMSTGGGEDTVPADFTVVSLTPNNDDYTVTGSKQIIYALAGNDTIENDSSIPSVMIYGGEGNDWIDNDGSSVTIDAGDGNDVIVNWNSKVTIDGGADADYINNSGDSVKIDAGAGNDEIHNVSSSVTIDAGAGADFISLYSGSYYANRGKNTISGGTGNDTIYMNSATTIGNVFQYSTGDGNDIVYNLSTKDTLQISGSYTTTKSGSDVIVSVGTGKITLKDYSGAVNIQSAASGSSSNLVSNDIFEDNNFLMPSTASAIDSLIDEDYSVTNLNFNFDADDIFAQKTELTFTNDK